MKRLPIAIIALAVIAFSTVAFAQGGDLWGEELTIKFFGLTLLGSVIVAAVVEKLKTWLKTTGWLNTAMALAFGVVLGALVYLLNLLFMKLGMVQETMSIWIYLVQGFFSGGVAAGLWKVARTLGKTRK